MSQQEEVQLKTRVIAIPFSMVVWFCGVAGTALTLTFGLGAIQTTMSNKMEANAAAIQRLEVYKSNAEKDTLEMKLQVQHIKSILEYQFPAAARHATH